MQVIHPPEGCPAERLIFIESKDKPYNLVFVEKVLSTARTVGATSNGSAGETFWVVFEVESSRICDLTETTLRRMLCRPIPERLRKEDIIAMGDTAPIGEILESFEYDGLHDYARQVMPGICLELEVFTLGETRKLKLLEIVRPQNQLASTKTLAYLNAVLREFGMPELAHVENT